MLQAEGWRTQMETHSGRMEDVRRMKCSETQKEKGGRKG